MEFRCAINCYYIDLPSNSCCFTTDVSVRLSSLTCSTDNGRVGGAFMFLLANVDI